MIVAPYAALLACLFVYLSLRVVRLRRQLQVAVGDRQEPRLTRAIRAHGNFAEYVPLSLLLILFLDGLGGPVPLVHGLSLLLLCGRSLHAYGISQPKEEFRFRILGMLLTFTSMLGAALGILLLTLIDLW
ncbi:MAPEG family protein [Aeromonas bivalvium]|uniref:MAPEG family protein n=1 Tax=Aeromonas bivalvium TaxID=440079 RepID=UPI0038CFD45B